MSSSPCCTVEQRKEEEQELLVIGQGRSYPLSPQKWANLVPTREIDKELDRVSGRHRPGSERNGPFHGRKTRELS